MEHRKDFIQNKSVSNYAKRLVDEKQTLDGNFKFKVRAQIELPGNFKD